MSELHERAASEMEMWRHRRPRVVVPWALDASRWEERMGWARTGPNPPEGWGRGFRIRLGPRWKQQQSWFTVDRQDPAFGEKGAIVAASRCASEQHRVICIDEKGPVAVKTYPGRTGQDADQRATYEVDYGRRGKVWIHGAFEPRTGLATVVVWPRRDSARHVRLLEQVVRTFPADRWTLIEDNLSVHHGRAAQLALAAWNNIRVLFLPPYACWLNLIEPWWKQLETLARRGHCFATLDELIHTIYEAVAYWNHHRYPYV